MSERHLTFHYTLRDGAGRVLDTSRGGQPLTCVEGAGQVVPGLERFLRALRPGDRRDVAVPPELDIASVLGVSAFMGFFTALAAFLWEASCQ